MKKTVVAAFNTTEFAIGQFGVNSNNITFTNNNYVRISTMDREIN